MKMTDVKLKAQALGIQPGKMRKMQLIHNIQASEGYEQCYGTRTTCPFNDCCFRKDCFQTAKKNN